MKNYFVITFVLLAGCANLISNFDQNSYNVAMELKGQSLALISHASEPYKDHESEINYLKSQLDAQLAYEEGKGKPNHLSWKQWFILTSPSSDLLGGTLKDWEGNPLSQVYIKERSEQIGRAFDILLSTEGSKHKE